MKFSPLLVFFGFLLVSCSSGSDRSNNVEAASSQNDSLLAIPTDPIEELSSEQQLALDALDTFQMNTDERGRVYSTFAGLEQPCYPPDTVFTISQAELLAAMNQFVDLHCKNMSVETRTRLAAEAVMAQEEYTLALCTDGSQELSFKNGLPLQGVWVMPYVLGRRDVVLVW